MDMEICWVDIYFHKVCMYKVELLVVELGWVDLDL